MEKTQEAAPAVPSERLSITPAEESTSVSYDWQNNKGTASHPSDSVTHDFDGPKDQNAELSAEDLAALEEGKELPGETSGADVDTGEKPEGGGAESADDTTPLPEFNIADEATVAAYDAKYVTTDEAGEPVLNFSAFNDEFSQVRTKEDGTEYRDINPESRKYLKGKFGISDKLIDGHLAGVQAQEREAQSIFHSQFADTPEEGKVVYDTMLEWAKANYTPEQKERYNKAAKAGGADAMEAIELLKTRFVSKNPASATVPGKATLETAAAKSPVSALGIGTKKVREVSPAKNATAAGTTARGPQPFANAEEHRHAQSAALKLPSSQREEAIAGVRKRLAASTFYK